MASQEISPHKSNLHQYWSPYIPHVVIPATKISNSLSIFQLVNGTSRHFLQPQSDNEALDDHAVEINAVAILDDDVVDTDSQQHKPVGLGMDLGTASLQRIVSQMKGLNVLTTNSTYDPEAAKKAGLPSYCDYLQGDTTSITTTKNAQLQSVLRK